MKQRGRLPAPEGSAALRRLWREVDGAVRLAFSDHPEYLSGSHSERTVRRSVVKRVVGQLARVAALKGSPSRERSGG